MADWRLLPSTPYISVNHVHHSCMILLAINARATQDVVPVILFLMIDKSVLGGVMCTGKTEGR